MLVEAVVCPSSLYSFSLRMHDQLRYPRDHLHVLQHLPGPGPPRLCACTFTKFLWVGTRMFHFLPGVSTHVHDPSSTVGCIKCAALVCNSRCKSTGRNARQARSPSHVFWLVFYLMDESSWRAACLLNTNLVALNAIQQCGSGTLCVTSHA